MASRLLSGAAGLSTRQAMLGRRAAPLMRQVRPMVMEQRRNVNYHEYQGKELMDKFGVNVQPFIVTENPDEAADAVKKWGEVVIKAQVHAGGRGQGTFTNGFKGGVKLSSDENEAREIASKMIGQTLVTKQTGADGVLVKKLMVAKALDFGGAKEMYFAILLDRELSSPVLVASAKGGMDIEKVAEEDPFAIFTVPVDINTGVTDKESGEVADRLGFSGEDKKRVQEQVTNLYKMFTASDATQVEINPLVRVSDGTIYCVDAKLNFDDNASFRQKQIFENIDHSEDDPREIQAGKFNLNYIGLDGNIGCMVNGAGLAMATMDIIKLHGGQPANFLDVGGGATEEQVKEAFKIISQDKKVQAILVNVFGGIVKCDTIARGVVNAARDVNLKMPLVVRLSGTNEEEGREILKQMPNIIPAVDMEEAAAKATSALN